MNASIRSSFRLFALVAFPLAAIFAACNSPTDVVIGTDQQPIACNNDASCPNNQACVNGFCDPQSGTTGSGNGGSSGTTMSATTVGVGGSGPLACSSDTDCSPSQACINGVCQMGAMATTGAGGAPAMCMSDSQCAMGQQTCVAGVCTNIGACATDADCPMGEPCVNGYCQVNSSTSTGMIGCMGMLPTPEVCDGIDNDCDGVVDNGASCGNNATCISGACVAVGACMTNADCAMGQQTCVAGVCTNIGACMSDAQCAMGQQTCVAGVCQNIMFCNSNANCNPMQTCVNGICKP